MKLKILGLVIVILGLAWWLTRSAETTVNLEGFAKCLAEKKITMYGAEWCSHCQNEKKKFGEVFKYVPYVECPNEPQKCLDAGIKGYPTWVWPDGKKLEGEQGVKKLSEASGCGLL